MNTWAIINLVVGAIGAALFLYVVFINNNDPSSSWKGVIVGIFFISAASVSQLANAVSQALGWR